jgi:hypothetical protein
MYTKGDMAEDKKIKRSPSMYHGHGLCYGLGFVLDGTVFTGEMENKRVIEPAVIE